MPGKDHPGFAIYLTGLPSSGKTTLAHAIKDMLLQLDIPVQVLDSDEMRRILTPNPTYSSQERDWFYDVLAFVASLLVHNKVNVIIAATAPLRAHRQAARSQIHRFVEVYINCPVDVCRARDPKGLWKRADAGEIVELPGAGFPYQPPEYLDVGVDSEVMTAQEAAYLVMAHLNKKGYI